MEQPGGTPSKHWIAFRLIWQQHRNAITLLTAVGTTAALLAAISRARRTKTAGSAQAALSSPGRVVVSLPSLPVRRLDVLGAYWRALVGKRRGVHSADAVLPKICVRAPISRESLEAHASKFADVVAVGPVPNAQRLTQLQCLTSTLFVQVCGHSKFPASILGSVAVRVRCRFKLDGTSREKLLADAVDAGRCIVECSLSPNITLRRQGYEFTLRTSVSADSTDTVREEIWESEFTALVFSNSLRGNPSEGAQQVCAPEFAMTDAEEVAQLPLNSGFGRRFAALCLDFNPIHLSAWTARAFGFQRCVAHGMGVTSIAVQLIVGSGYLQSSELRALDVQFRRPVFIPGRYTLLVSRTGCPEGTVAFAVVSAELWRTWDTNERLGRAPLPNISGTVSA